MLDRRRGRGGAWLILLALLALSGCGKRGELRADRYEVEVTATVEPVSIRLPWVGEILVPLGATIRLVQDRGEALQPSGSISPASLERGTDGRLAMSTGAGQGRSVVDGQAVTWTWLGIGLIFAGVAWLVLGRLPWMAWTAGWPKSTPWVLLGLGGFFSLLPGVVERLVGPLATVVFIAVIVGAIAFILWRTGALARLWQRAAVQTEDGIARFRKRDPVAGEDLVADLQAAQDREVQDDLKRRRPPAARGTPGGA